MPTTTIDDPKGCSIAGLQRRRVRDYWTKRARWYEEYSSWCKDPQLFALCTATLRSLGPEAKCLDLGGGSGWLARRDAKLYGRDWTVLDACPDFERYVGAAVEFVVGDAESTPFDNSSFDFIVVRSLLHYVDAPRLLAEASRLLSPRGRLVVAQKVATHVPSDDAWYAEFEQLKNPECHREWRVAELLGMFECSGFRVLSRESFEEHRSVNVREWFSSSGRLPNPRQDSINRLLRSAPPSVRTNLRLSFIGDLLLYAVRWSICTLEKTRTAASPRSNKRGISPKTSVAVSSGSGAVP